MQTPIPARKLIRRRDVMAKLAVSETTLDRIEQRDPTFPRRIAIGLRAVAFYEDELDGWLEQQRRSVHQAVSAAAAPASMPEAA